MAGRRDGAVPPPGDPARPLADLLADIAEALVARGAKDPRAPQDWEVFDPEEMMERDERWDARTRSYRRVQTQKVREGYL